MIERREHPDIGSECKVTLMEINHVRRRIKDQQGVVKAAYSIANDEQQKEVFEVITRELGLAKNYLAMTEASLKKAYGV